MTLNQKKNKAIKLYDTYTKALKEMKRLALCDAEFAMFLNQIMISKGDL